MVGVSLVRVRCGRAVVAGIADEVAIDVVFRSELRSDVPVLAISGTLDSRTPPSNAEEALAGFSQVHHLLIVGGAHDDDLLIATDAIGEAIVRFLETGDPGTERVQLPPL